MKIFVSLAASFLSGIIGSMGMGGGAVLIIYLAVFSGMDQFKAQGINLLFFIPIAVTALIIYIRKKNIDLKTVLPFAVGGIPGCVIGIGIASLIGVKLVARIFGGGIALLGVYETVKGIKTVLARNKNR